MIPVMLGAVLVTAASSAPASAPPGVDTSAWWRALVEDTQDVVAAVSYTHLTLPTICSV